MIAKMTQTVTSLPVLVRCKPSDRDGRIISFSPDDVLDWRMREVTEKDLKRVIADILQTDDGQLLRGALALMNAYKNEDLAAMKTAFDMVWPYLADPMLRNYTDPKGEAARMAEHYSENALSSARSQISQLVTRQLETARLVLWWSPEIKQFRPAVYCRDITSAAYMKLFMKLGFPKNSLASIRVCPHCGNMFCPPRTNIDYCCPAHREAHRVARWRARKREEEKKKKKRR
jgi:hypothetical protein